jgi:hypothetical protein
MDLDLLEMSLDTFMKQNSKYLDDDFMQKPFDLSMVSRSSKRQKIGDG